MHFVRTNHDQTTIKAKAEKAGRIVVIGSGFIGSESASCLAMKYGKDASKQIHLVSNTEYPLEKVLGKEYGRMLKKDHEANGVRFHSSAPLKEMNCDFNGNVTSVTLGNGEILAADLVIFGTGVRPATCFLKDSGIQLNADGGVICDPFL